MESLTSLRVNVELLPVKAHFFFFMAASGPILPFLVVYGKQLGISEVVMGTITAVLPLLFLVAKPVFGFVVDYFYGRRKQIFMCLVFSMALFYCLLYFIPPSYHMNETLSFSMDDSCSAVSICENQELDEYKPCQNDQTRRGSCNLTCTEQPQIIYTSPSLFRRNETHIMSQVCVQAFNYSGQVVSGNFCEIVAMDSCKMSCRTDEQDDCVYKTFTFYAFIIIMSLGMIAYNVANSISDAICVDMLGPGNQNSYGKERVWGSIGFGIAALLGGLSMDLWSNSGTKDYTPAFVMVMIFCVLDLMCCTKLRLPSSTQSNNILKDVCKVIKSKEVVIFLIFATIVGVFDSFIMFFMFWFLEDLAISSDRMTNIKFIEGLTVAAETLGGEVVFFPLAGKIIDLIGYGHCFTLCFFNYALRLGLISLVRNPWWIIPIEFFMQGPTYALCYNTIVAYAGAVSPPNASATMQGLAAGMDDGFGYAIGSFIGGMLYSYVGGRYSFQIFCMAAGACCVLHFVLYMFVLRHGDRVQSRFRRDHASVYKSTTEALEMTVTA